MTSKTQAPTRISFVASTALGIGGMMGAGLYTLVGMAAEDAGSLVPVSFAVGAMAAALSVYSYARLGARFPGRGGSAHFINVAYGSTMIAGGVNVFQYFGYVVAASLYAAGFAEYARALVGASAPWWFSKVAGVLVVVVFCVVALVNSRLVAKAQSAIVGLELVILLAFVGWGAFHADPHLATANVRGLSGVLTASALLYVTYQGFGVIANASGRMADPKSQLPRSMFTALVIVAAMYISISTLIVMILQLDTLESDSGHALASAAQAVAGPLGFAVMGGAALLATASAVNATLFAATNIALDESVTGQLPARMGGRLGPRGSWALVVSAAGICVLVLVFPLDAVGSMTSMAFLLVYGLVSLGHMRLRAQTGARAWPLVAAVVVNAALFVLLLADSVRKGPMGAWITLVVAFAVSFAVAGWLRARQRQHRLPAGTASEGGSKARRGH